MRLPGTRTPLPEVKIESDGQTMDTMQDHHEIRGNYEPRGGGEEVQMEPVEPAHNPPEDQVAPIAPGVPVATGVRLFVSRQEYLSLVPGI